MVFEAFVLVAVCWNAFDRPRDAQLPIRRALHRDGIIFFAVRMNAIRRYSLGLISSEPGCVVATLAERRPRRNLGAFPNPFSRLVRPILSRYLSPRANTRPSPPA